MILYVCMPQLTISQDLITTYGDMDAPIELAKL